MRQVLTLREQAQQAKIILYGTLANPRKTPQDSVHEGYTDLIIHHAYRMHPLLEKKTSVTLPTYVPVEDPKNPPAFIVFCDYYKGKPDPFKGIPVRSQGVVDYVHGLLNLKESDHAKALVYFSRYLKHDQSEVADDAYLEWLKASPQDVRQAATQLDPDEVAALLQDPKTPRAKLGRYGLMLGHCGRDKHARLLREILARQPGDGIDSDLLIGYTLLNPADGLACMRGFQGHESFLKRYGVLEALRYFWSERPDVAPKKEIVEIMTSFLSCADMADLPIEDLRRWRQWQLTDKVLDVWHQEAGTIPVTRRAILHFALRSREAAAAVFVREQRRLDPEGVREIEALLPSGD